MAVLIPIPKAYKGVLFIIACGYLICLYVNSHIFTFVVFFLLGCAMRKFGFSEEKLLFFALATTGLLAFIMFTLATCFVVAAISITVGYFGAGRFILSLKALHGNGKELFMLLWTKYLDVLRMVLPKRKKIKHTPTALEQTNVQTGTHQQQQNVPNVHTGTQQQQTVPNVHTGTQQQNVPNVHTGTQQQQHPNVHTGIQQQQTVPNVQPGTKSVSYNPGERSERMSSSGSGTT